MAPQLSGAQPFCANGPVGLWGLKAGRGPDGGSATGVVDGRGQTGFGTDHDHAGGLAVVTGIAARPERAERGVSGDWARLDTRVDLAALLARGHTTIGATADFGIGEGPGGTATASAATEMRGRNG